MDLGGLWFELPLLMDVIELGVIVSVPCIPLLGVRLTYMCDMSSYRQGTAFGLLGGSHAYMCDMSSYRQGTAFGLLGGSHHHSLETLVLA